MIRWLPLSLLLLSAPAAAADAPELCAGGARPLVLRVETPLGELELELAPTDGAAHGRILPPSEAVAPAAAFERPEPQLGRVVLTLPVARF